MKLTEPGPGLLVKPKKSLLELRTRGWNKLRPDRIHVRCPHCGRKHSNGTRGEYDPPTAWLVEILCEKCSMGCKDPTSEYFDAAGRAVDWYEYYCQKTGDENDT